MGLTLGDLIMARRKLSDEEKAAKKSQKESPEFIEGELEKLRAKESKLMAMMAIKQHPGLEDAIETISNFVQEVDRAIKAGANVSLAKKQERLQKQIAHYEEKIAAIKEKLSETNEDSLLESLSGSRSDALTNLKNAVASVSSEVMDAGVTVESLVPTIEPFMADIS
jgi:valyl-tRNA synthetase